MKKIFLWAVLLSLIGFVIFYFILRPSIINDVKSALNASGLQIVKIDSEKLTLSGITLSKISLNDPEFNSIETIKINVTWPRFFTAPINSVAINNLKYSSVYSQNFLSHLYRNTEKIKQQLSNTNIPRIEIINYTWDISTSLAPIRFTGDLFLTNDNGGKELKILINSAQHALSFNSEIQAVFKKDIEKWDFNIKDTKLNSNLLSFSRANGWFNYIKEKEISEFSGQFDIGSGKILSLPLNNIQLIAAQKLGKPNIPVIIRAKLNGIKNSNLTGDVQISSDINHQDFHLKLTTVEASEFIAYLKENQVIRNTVKNTILNDESLHLEIKHMKERRFADGPYPFSFASNVKNKKINGTFIFYPEDVSIRGSASGNKDLLSITNEILFRKDLDSDSGTIRFEKNLLQGNLFN